jgi:hypothetical protein
MPENPFAVLTTREAALRTVLMTEQHVIEQEALIAKAFDASP